MNRSLGMAKYLMFRQKIRLPIYLTILFALALGTAAISMSMGYSVHMEYMGGGYKVGPSYAGSDLYNNSSSFTNSFLYQVYVWVIPLALMKRERRFMLTMSVARHEYLAGTYVFLLALSAVMTVAMWLTSVIGYAGLWALGYGLGASITPWTLLTGNWSGLMVAFSSMACGAGVMTLGGYVLARWWKPILIAMGAFIAVVILFATQANLRANAATVIEWLTKVVYWVSDVALPAIDHFIWQASDIQTTLMNLLAGLIATALSYPVMYGLKVAK